MTIDFEATATKLHWLLADDARRGFAYLLPDGISPLTGVSEKQISYGESCRAKFLFMQAVDVVTWTDDEGLARAMTMIDAAAAEIEQPRQLGERVPPTDDADYRLARRIAAVRKIAKNDSAPFWIDSINNGFILKNYILKELGGVSL